MRPRFGLALAVAALAVCCWVTPAVARPTALDSGETEDYSSEPDAISAAEAHALSNPDSLFGRELRAQLAAISESDLNTLQNNLPTDEDTANQPEDGEMMMGDMASQDPAASPDAEHLSKDQELEILKRNRENAESATETAGDRSDDDDSSTPDKKLQIQSIQKKILNFVATHGSRPNPSPSPMFKANPASAPAKTDSQAKALRILYENVNNFPSYPTDVFTEKSQSFYPTCEIPRHTSSDAWNSKDSMNLMFNISFPKASNGISVTLSAAKLRLFKQLVTCTSQTSNETTDDPPSCQPILSEETINRSSAANISLPLDVPTIMEDKQIRVSIYAHTRSLKKRRVKRKLLDSRMIPYHGEKWTEWNIRNAVKMWRRDATKNYGISIEIEDEDGNLLPANRFFKPMNCTGDAQTATPKPIPGFLMEAAQREFDPDASPLQTYSFNLSRYPMVDVTTIEVPESEAQQAILYQNAKYAYEQNLASMMSKSGGAMLEAGQEADVHRIRHANYRHRANSSSSADAADAAAAGLDGRDIRDQIIVQSIIYRNNKTATAKVPA